MLPADNIWNTPVDQLPTSSLTSTYVNTIGATKTVHADFGSGLYGGAPIGIPYVTVTGSQTKYPATFLYSGESDPGPYAVPLDAPIEGGPQGTGDRHTLSIDTTNCILYELYKAYPQASSWKGNAGAIFDLRSNALRPAGWTSTDAAGLPIFPGLVRYDEIEAGEIRHALRFTVPQTRRAYVWPARHYASSLTGSQYPPMGGRFRLRADFDISGFSRTNQIILRALKKYGMMISDNGSAWFITGIPDSRWNNDDLHKLGGIAGSNFEYVDISSLMIDSNSGQARQPAGVAVSVNPSSFSLAVNASKQFTASVSNSTNQTVQWSVNGVAAGNSVVGWISNTGYYTAPAVVPSGGKVTVEATSNAAPATVGTATATITAGTTPPPPPPPPPSGDPVLTSISPAGGIQGTSMAVVLTGANFKAGASLWITGGSGLAASNVVVASSTRITATFTIGSLASGARSVMVRTTEGTSGAVTFTIAPKPIAPTLTSLTPASAARGATVTVMLRGRYLSEASAVSVAGGVATVTGIDVVDPTSVRAVFRINATAAPGAYATTVQTPAGTSNALPFTVK